MAHSSSVADIFETMVWGPAPESAEVAMAWLDRHQRHLCHFIGNTWRASADGATFETFSPGNGQLLATVARGGKAEVDAAVAAARDAFEPWSRTSGHARARYLYALAREVQKNARLLAVLESLDNGKPIRESRDVDVPLVARHFSYHAGWAQLMESELPGCEPVGVVAQIIPWNFPLLMLAWKIAPALAMGNTVVLKPSRYAPLTALAFAELVELAGLPPGVVNVLAGDGAMGALLAEHPGVDKIAFTGSTEIGRVLRKVTAGTGKRLSLELGGKSPFVVFDDADLDSAVEGLVDAIWFNQGQVCCAGSRLLVQESIAEPFLAKVRARMAKLRVGDPLDKAIDLGAIISPAQLETIAGLVEQGRAEGAEVWQPPDACPREGWFYPPTLVTNVGPASTLAQVEIFGPVLVALSFRTPAEAAALANNTRYGLAASVWTQDVDQALDVALGIKAGTVWINGTNQFDAGSGFGGYRESGYGREGGREGLWEYVRRAPARVTGDGSRMPGDVSASGTGLPARRPRGAAADGERETDTRPLTPDTQPSLPPINRTPKLFIGGKQTRPDGGYSRLVRGPDGRVLGEVGEGNRKDIRNAVEAARAAQPGWWAASAYNRAQVLYYLAENLSVRDRELAERIRQMTGCGAEAAAGEVEASIERLFTYAAWADKFEGRIHVPPMRGAALAVPEPIGVMGVACPNAFPLLGLVSLVAPAVAMGNTVVAIPSEAHPLSGTDLYQVLETSDVPAGVVNLVTGARDALAKVLAEHDDVDALWYVGTAEGRKMVEEASITNMKRTWTELESEQRAWLDPGEGAGEEFLREATQVKNIWIPWGA